MQWNWYELYTVFSIYHTVYITVYCIYHYIIYITLILCADSATSPPAGMEWWAGERALHLKGNQSRECIAPEVQYAPFCVIPSSYFFGNSASDCHQSNTNEEVL